MDSLEALQVFEFERPGHYRKLNAIAILLWEGVPREGIAEMIKSAPWPIDSKQKWLRDLPRLYGKAPGPSPVDFLPRQRPPKAKTPAGLALEQAMQTLPVGWTEAEWLWWRGHPDELAGWYSG